RRGAGARAPSDRRPGGALERDQRRDDRAGRAREDARPGVTRRGRSVLALGLVVYLAAWAFGSKPLYPVAAGLLVAAGLTWVWTHLANGSFLVHRDLGEREPVEGDDVQLSIAVEPGGTLPVPVAALVESVGGLGEQRHVLRKRGRRLAITYLLHEVR